MRYTLIAADKSNQLSINIPEEIISKKVPLKKSILKKTKVTKRKITKETPKPKPLKTLKKSKQFAQSLAK